MRRRQRPWPRTNTTQPQGDRRRPGLGRSEQNCTATIRETPFLSRSSSICRLTKSLAGRGLHTAEQMVDSAPVVPILDILVPLMVEQLVDVLQFFDALFPVVEQVIDVPKIILEDIPPRISVREPQLAEQLVEVPTILHFLKQTVDIPVPRGCGRRLQGFLQE